MSGASHAAHACNPCAERFEHVDGSLSARSVSSSLVLVFPSPSRLGVDGAPAASAEPHVVAVVPRNCVKLNLVAKPAEKVKGGRRINRRGYAGEGSGR